MAKNTIQAQQKAKKISNFSGGIQNKPKINLLRKK